MAIDRDLSCYILAGGSEPLLGKPKAELEWHEGLTLLETVKKEFSALHPHSLKEDLIRGLGPVGGIYTGLKASGKHWSLFLPCDMPFLKVDTVWVLVQALETEPGLKGGFFEVDEVQSFPCILHRDLLPAVRMLMRKGEREARKLANEQDVIRAPLPDPGMKVQLLNLNSAEAYQQALKHKPAPQDS